MGSLYKNIQLMMKLCKGPFLVLHVSYYTLMIFLMLSVIQLSTLESAEVINVAKTLMC